MLSASRSCVYHTGKYLRYDGYEYSNIHALFSEHEL